MDLESQRVKDKLREWAYNPRLFIIEALRFEERGYTLTTQQEECVEEVRRLVTAKVMSSAGMELDEETKEYASKMGVSVMSGKGTGKDALAAMLVLWFITCFYEPKIPCTANSARQLSEVLWSEIRKWLNDSLIDDLLVLQSDKLFFKVPDKQAWGKRWFATARTVNAKAAPEEQVEVLAGLHEDFMMFVIDEASGIPEPVFKPFETTLTGRCNFVFMIFNPTRSHGFAIDSQTKHRKDWICLHWDAEKSELAQQPQFAEQIKRIERKYGRDSNTFRINVKGLPPHSDPDTLIPYDWVMNAVDREMEVSDEEPLLLGIDVGAGGDKSVILHYRGGCVERITEHNTKNTMELVGWVAQEMDEYEADAAFVDVIGLGNGVYGRLVELGYKVYSVDVRSTPRSPERFKKLRDELWWTLREQFEQGLISIPSDDELIGELSNIKYEPESNGAIKVEGKKELRRRGVESPNKADALGLIFYMSRFTFAKQSAEKYGAKKAGRVLELDSGNEHSWMGG